MITLHGLANCDRCRKARKWLDSQGMTHRFRDIRKEPVVAAEIGDWLNRIGVDDLVNRRSTTWRALPEQERARLGGPGTIALLVAHPTLLKRPLIDRGDRLFVGLDASVIGALQSGDSGDAP